MYTPLQLTPQILYQIHTELEDHKFEREKNRNSGLNRKILMPDIRKMKG